MKLPYYSLDELWRELSTEHIGFFTHKTCDAVPSGPGVYAWFTPIRLDGSLDDVLKRYKRLFSCDPLARSQYKKVFETEYQWQKGRITTEATDEY